jgi:hypothetical protein
VESTTTKKNNMNNKIYQIILDVEARTHETIVSRMKELITKEEAKDQFEKTAILATDQIEGIIEENSFNNDYLNG